MSKVAQAILRCPSVPCIRDFFCVVEQCNNFASLKHQSTEPEVMVCVWLGDIDLCSCLTILPVFAWFLLSYVLQTLFPSPVDRKSKVQLKVKLITKAPNYPTDYQSAAVLELEKYVLVYTPQSYLLLLA